MNNEEMKKDNLDDIEENYYNCDENLSVNNNEHIENDENQQKEIRNILDFGKIIDSVSGLSKKMDDMNEMFIRKIQHTEYEEKIVDRMHSELQKYKEDMYSQLLKPILLDMIDIRDGILRMAKIYKDKPEGKQDIPNKIFADYALDIKDILEKNQVEIYKSNIEDSFSPLRQRAIKKVETSNEELHGKIAESMSCGYIYVNRIISAEKVAIYCYKKNESEE